ncbi:HNH endonuclease [Kitasatospora sp. NPDC057965]|uniref:HNH endonuclease n=1 Tax=Kitasatospora sp. NPDC057965 TaxID=3346291 RepID=UPI0036DEBAC3
MLPLSKPQLNAATVFDTCSSTARSKADREILKNLTPAVADAVAQYENAAAGQALHGLQHLQHQPGGPPTGKTSKLSPVNRTLVNGYTSRMVAEGSVGHDYYEKIRASAPDGRCSLCGHGTAQTLDHQLPKGVYPLLAVAPSNLAPACRDCNTNKRDKAPLNAQQQTLNPYFDHEAQQYTWVAARIIGPPIAVTFHAIPPPEMPPLLAARARYHFAELKLATLYASQAASPVRVESRNLQKRRLTPPQVRDHLAAQAEFWTAENRNGWQAALYTELAANDWYTTEGYRDGGPTTG